MQRKSQHLENNNYKKALNVILIVLGSILVVLSAFLLFITITASFMPVGYGDIILFADPLIIMSGIVSVAYIILVVIYSIRRLKEKMPQSKLHIIAAISILIIGLLPYFGPIRLAFNATFQPVIQSVSRTIKDSQFEGPTEEQITQANLESFDKAQALFDGCNVSSILYWRYDSDGPHTQENSYIIVQARNNGTIAYGEAPPNVHLPASDKDKLVDAIKNYSKGPYPACKLEIPWKNMNSF